MPSRPLSPDAIHRALRAHFGPATFARALIGVRDAKSIGRFSAEKAGDDEYTLRGEVNDAALHRTRAQVFAALDPAEFEIGDTDCTCPTQTNCKHACELALHWLTLWPGLPGVSGQVEYDGIATLPHTGDDLEPTHPDEPPPEPVTRILPIPGELNTWLKHAIEAALAEGADKKPAPRLTPCIVYVLTDLARLHAVRGRRTREGHEAEILGDYAKANWLDQGAMPSYAVAADAAVLRLMRAGRHVAHFGADAIATLEGEEGAQLLALAAGTGRLYAMNEAGLAAALGKRAEAALRVLPPPLAFAPARPAGLAWREAKVGTKDTLQLAATLAGEAAHLIPTLPPHALDIARHRITPIDVVLSPASLARLASLPPVPRDDALAWAYVRDAIAALPDAPAVPPLPLARDIEVPRPRAILSFALAEYRHQVGWGRDAFTDTTVIPVAELQFDYAGRRVGVSGRGLDAAIEVEQQGARRRTTLARNVREETLWQKRLPARLERASSVEPTLAMAALEERTRAQSLWALRDHDWATHGAEVLADAQAAGFVLEIDPSFPLTLEDVPAPDLELTPTPERGWFRVALGVTVDGERMDLAPALAKLIGAQAEPEAWLAQLPSVPTVLLSVAPQRMGGRAAVVRLAGERLHAILAPVFDWFRGGEPGISALQAALQPDLPATAVKYLGRDDKRWIALRDAVAEGVRLRPVAPAEGFLATLRPYQLHGLAWLDHLHALGMAGVLADDMGLGKTVQTLAFLHSRKAGGETKPSLIIAPTSVTVNWQAEAARFVPGMNVLVHRGAARSLTDAALAGVDLIVTSYPILQRDESRFAELAFDVVVFDEAQTIKNARAKTYQAAQSLNAHMRLALTGTPMENHLGELWALFNLLLPGLLGDLDNFNRVFRHPIEQRAATGQMVKLRARIRPFLLRRTREQVLDDLPEKTEYTRWIELNADQTDLYESLRTAIHDDIRKAIDKKGLAQSTIHILDALLKLRQVCCDPRLVRLPEGDAKSTRFSNAGSAKLDWLMNHIPELLDEGRQVLVFSQFTSMLALIGEALTARGIDYESLTGDTQDRATPVARFQAGEVKVFLLSLKAGGVGLNLTAADTVIHYDPWWNPAVEAQATARAHRMGQEKAVFVTKLVSRGTLEERMLVLLARKRELAGALLEGEGSALTGLTVADVEELLAPVSTFVAQTK